MSTIIWLDPEIEARFDELARAPDLGKYTCIKELIHHRMDELKDRYLGALE